MLNETTFQFFRELKENNHKEWFDENRPRYELVKKDYHALVKKILDIIQEFDPRVADLEIKDCTFRINKDIRFSKDKSPYKTHLAIVVNPFGKKMETPSYYIHLDEKEGSFVGGGLYMPQGPTLKKIRKEISNYAEEFESILKDKDFVKHYTQLDESESIKLKRPPQGYDENSDGIEWLKLKSFTATHPISMQEIKDSKWEQKIKYSLQTLKPLLDFLNRAIKEN